MKYFALTAAIALMSTSVSAATIGVVLTSDVKVGGNTRIIDEVLDGQNPVPLTGNETQSVTAQDADQFGPGRGTATASYTVDQATGSFNFGASADITAPTSQVESSAGSLVQLNIAETFNIHGTGDITLSLAIDGFLNASTARNGSAQFDARMRLVDQTGAFGFDVIGSDSISAKALVGTSTMIDEVLQFTTTITKSQDYLFLLGLNASASTFQKGTGNSGSANANFLNTALLSFTAADTLTVTASDPAFLGGAAPVAPVPLPAGVVLMLSGFAALRLAKRKPAHG